MSENAGTPNSQLSKGFPVQSNRDQSCPKHRWGQYPTKKGPEHCGMVQCGYLIPAVPWTREILKWLHGGKKVGKMLTVEIQ